MYKPERPSLENCPPPHTHKCTPYEITDIVGYFVTTPSVTNGINATLQAEVKTLTDHLESIKQDLAAEKQKNHLLEQQLQLRGTGTPITRGAGQSSSGSGVSEALAEKVATLEIKELNERQRADLASVRYSGSMLGSGCLVFQGRKFSQF